MDNLFFEHLKNGGGGQVVTGPCFHWQEPQYPPLAIDTWDPTRSIFVSDEYYSWASLHVPGIRLYRMTVVFRTPLVLLEQLADYEEMFPYREDTPYTKLVERGGFDSIIYTPHPYGRGMRQALIINPHKQVISISEVTNYNRVAIEKKQKYMHPHWSRLMLPSPPPAPKNV